MSKQFLQGQGHINTNIFRTYRLIYKTTVLTLSRVLVYLVTCSNANRNTGISVTGTGS